MQPLNPHNLADRAVCHALRMLDDDYRRIDVTATRIETMRHRHRYVLNLLDKLSLLRGDSKKQ